MSRISEHTSEPMTREAWNSLFQRAQGAVVPYYLIAEAIIGPGIHDTSWYDGISFRRSILENPQLFDPITNRTIRKVHYYVLKCFEVDLSEPSLRRNIPFDQALASMFKIPENFERDPIAAEALNFISAENLLNATLVRKCQYIIGMRFLQVEALKNPKENMRWLVSAAVDFPQAQETLNDLISASAPSVSECS